MSERSEFMRGTVRGVDLSAVDNSKLGEDDEQDVKKELLDVAHRWTHVGGALRIKRSKIKAIKNSNHDVEECLGEVISSWLEQDYNVERFGPPTWRWMVKAVAEEAGGSNPALAEKIAKKHPIASRNTGVGPSQRPTPTTAGAFQSSTSAVSKDTRVTQEQTETHHSSLTTLGSPFKSWGGPRSLSCSSSFPSVITRDGPTQETSMPDGASQSPVSLGSQVVREEPQLHHSKRYHSWSELSSVPSYPTSSTPPPSYPSSITHPSYPSSSPPSYPSSSPPSYPSSSPGASGGSKKPNYNWFPNDGKQLLRVDTDGGRMTCLVYEPYSWATTSQWGWMELSCGQVPIERQQDGIIKQGPYTMQTANHGLAIVINNEQFDKQKHREGSRIDEYNLIQTFRYLGYRVEAYRDCTSKEMSGIFEGVQLRNHSGSDSFVCCILSHGADGKVYGSDSETIDLDNLTKKLNAQSCQGLAGKPKLFFIQACRGVVREPGVRVACDGGFLELPNEADFLFSYASPSGQACFRDLDNGSWYVSELCQVLCRSATQLHLNDLLMEVHWRVGKYQVQDDRQAPEITQRLQRNVYFF